MRHQALVLRAPAVLFIGGCAAMRADAALDLSREPQVLRRTAPSLVGDRYTLGMTSPEQDAILPLGLTTMEVLNATVSSSSASELPASV